METVRFHIIPPLLVMFTFATKLLQVLNTSFPICVLRSTPSHSKGLNGNES